MSTKESHRRRREYREPDYSPVFLAIPVLVLVLVLTVVALTSILGS